MRGYFDTEPLREKLEEVAQSWVGTPFMANAAKKQRGVSCHNLAYAIFEECGVRLPFDSPEGGAGVGGHSRRAFISEFLDRQPMFERLCVAPYALIAGDLVSFRLDAGEYHLAVMLPNLDGQFLRVIHAIKPGGVQITNLVGRPAPDSSWRLRTDDRWNDEPA